MTSLFPGRTIAPGLHMSRSVPQHILDSQPGSDRRDRNQSGRRQSDAGGSTDDPGGGGGIVIRRWVFTMLLSALSGAGVFIWQASRQTTLSEARVVAIERRVETIEKLLEEYERLRYQRERQIAELQTQQANTSRTLDQMRNEVNAKLDRLIYGQVRR